MPASEDRRLSALKALRVLDTPPEAALDRITALAADLFDAPTALVSLIDEDRQWFKSRFGMAASCTPRSQAFCDHTIQVGKGGLMVVEDATLDPRFAGNPLVTGPLAIRFYAGAVLANAAGDCFGSLCVIDYQPRPRPSERDLARLQALADTVVQHLEDRLDNLNRQRKAALLDLAEAMSGVGRWSFIPDTGELDWSDEVYSIHGVSRDSFDLAVDNAIDFYHPEDRPKVAEFLRRAQETGEGFAFQLRLIRPDGDLRDVVCRAACELDETGATVAIIGAFQDITPHTTALRQAHAGEARFRRLADNMGDVITRLTLQGRGKYISPAIRDLLGHDPDDLPSADVRHYIHSDDHPDLEAALVELAGGADSLTLELRAMHRDGRILWAETHFRLVRDDAGRPQEIVAVIRDVSGRKALQAKLADSEARYRTLAEGVSDILLRYGPDGRITYASPACKVLGYTPEEAIGQPLTRFIDPDYWPESKSIMAGNFRAGALEAAPHPIHRALTRDGRVLWLEGSPRPVLDDMGRVAEVITVLRDITDRKAMEAALAESEARFRSLADNASDVLVRFGPDRTVRYVSPACRTFGYEPEELVGRPLDSLFAPGHRPSQPNVDFENPNQATRRNEIVLLTKDGRTVTVESSPTLLRDAEGRIVEVISVMRDISERKTLEAELILARTEAETAARAKAEFLANMSHEIRTPLTAVLGYSGLLADTPNLPEDARGYVRRIESGGRALMATVNDILDFSKLEAGQVEIRPEACDVAQLADEALHLFDASARAKALDLSCQKDDLPLLWLDGGRLRQVLLNLIGNAVKFSDAGSVQVKVGWNPVDQRLRIAVMDSGCGISPEAQSLLFRKFSQVDASSTRRHGGTGLGLAICKGLVEAMGGVIGVDSRPGAGSTFWLEVPAPRINPEDVAAAPAATSSDDLDLLNGARILIVDDNGANRNLASAVLVKMGAICVTAVDGESAIEMAEAQPFDLIMMDVRMPGMGGPAAARAIHQGGGPNDSVPILAFSADADPLSLGKEFSGVIVKPIVLPELVSALRTALGEPDLRTAHHAS